MKCVSLILLVFTLHPAAEPLDLLNIGRSAVDLATGIIEKIPDVIPSKEALFQYSKNVVAGYPVEKVDLQFFSSQFFQERNIHLQKQNLF